MTECVIYQTLEDRDNYDEVEDCGPFPCSRSNAWLGNGYYFWDDEIIMASNWARQAGYNSNYIICQSSYDYDNHNYLDLVGHPKHLKLFRDFYSVLKEKLPNKKIKVPKLIEFVKGELGRDFNYKAIRARSEWQDHNFIVDFPTPPNRPAQLNLHPQIQICVIDKSFLISPFLIVYPESAVK